jgi:membrane protease YdiL (CAAX protease family)
MIGVQSTPSAGRADDSPSAWWVLGGFLATFVLGWGVSVVWGLVLTRLMNLAFANPTLRGTLGALVSRGGSALLQGILWALAFRLVFRRRLREGSLAAHRGWLANLLIGMGVAALAMLVVFAVEVGAGWLTVEGWTWGAVSPGAWLVALWTALLTGTVAAVLEEIAFRGFLLEGLARAWGKWIGLVASALIFALPHLLVSTAGEVPWLLFVPALMLPGLMLGWAYLQSGSLWLPIGVHFAWNVVQANLLNLPGSATDSGLFGLLTQLRGPGWLVGTAYGIEVGLVGVLAVAIVVTGVWGWSRIRPAAAG